LNGSAGFTQPSAPASARQTAPTRQERRETAIGSPPAPAAPRGARRTGDRKGLSVGPPAGLEPRAPGSYVAPEGIPIALYLGIDVGGTKTAFALGDGEGAIFASERMPTPLSGDPAADLRAIAERCRALLAGQGRRVEEVAAVGVAMPSPLDAETGVVLNPPNLPSWHGTPVRRLLEEALGRPVALENDANAAALAEFRFGAGRASRDMVFLTMSTGVGGGLVLGGRLVRGVASSAGEVGHLPVEWGGEPCTCGLRGCLEAYTGGAAWTRRLARVTPADSAVARLAGGAARARPEHVVAAALEGDAFALAELDRYNDYLARGLVAVAYTVAPERIVLGTIPTAAGEALCFGPLRERFRRHVWPFLAERIAIVPSALGKALPAHAGIVVALGAGEGG
jgi:glucokinase